MHNYHYNGYHLGWGLLAFVLWLILMFGLVLVGIWLWRRNKKK